LLSVIRRATHSTPGSICSFTIQSSTTPESVAPPGIYQIEHETHCPVLFFHFGKTFRPATDVGLIIADPRGADLLGFHLRFRKLLEVAIEGEVGFLPILGKVLLHGSGSAGSVRAYDSKHGRCPFRQGRVGRACTIHLMQPHRRSILQRLSSADLGFGYRPNPSIAKSASGLLEVSSQEVWSVVDLQLICHQLSGTINCRGQANDLNFATTFGSSRNPVVHYPINTGWSVSSWMISPPSGIPNLQN
jgi:hypothetical protein